MKIVQIDGGIGRVLASTGAVKELCQKQEKKPIVLTSWPEVFWFNPCVYKVYSLNREWLFDDVIRQGDFVLPEPYHQRKYYTQQQHLSASFNEILNQKDAHVLPELYLTQQEKIFGLEFVENVRKTTGKQTVIAYQPFGAGFTIQDSDPTHRSLSFDRASKLASMADDVMFLNCSHISLDHANVWQRQFTMRELFAVVFACDYVVCVDSAVSHIGAAFGKKGILLLGATFEKNVGYPDNYVTIQRNGYPKSYFANRFNGFVDENAGAMDFDDEDLSLVARIISSRDFMKKEEANGAQEG